MADKTIIQNLKRLEAGDDFTLARWATLNPDALYGIAGEFAKDACLKSEADPAAVLMTLLTRMGTYFGRDACLWHGGMRFPPKLYVAIAGRSAKGRKGTSTYPVVDIAERIDKILIRHALNPTRAVDGTAASGEGLAYMLRDASEKKDEDGKPLDEGIEDKRLFLLEEELGGLLKIAKREGNSVTAALRKLWDSSGTFHPITKTNPIKATGTHICMVAHVTFGELLTHLNSVESSNGFANRFLWVCSRRSKVESEPETIPSARLDMYAGEFADAVIFAERQKSGLNLSKDASVLWHSLYRELDIERGGLVGNLCDRAHAQVLRVATIFAILDKSAELTPEHLKAARAVWQYCEDSISYIFGADIDQDEQKIMTYLQDQNGQEVAQTVLSRRLFKDKPSTLANKLLRLEEQGKVSRRSETGKGRTATYWKLALAENLQNTG